MNVWNEAMAPALPQDSLQQSLLDLELATQQHLSGSIALWKSESYLDDEIQLQIKQLK